MKLVLLLLLFTPQLIAETAGGRPTTATNIGTGTGQVYKDRVGNTLELRTIKAGSNITITNNASDITISSSAIGGGGITGPGTSTVGDVATFGDTVGGSITDAGILASAVFLKDGTRAATGAFAMGGFKIGNLASPTLANDAATKGYVDGLAVSSLTGEATGTGPGATAITLSNSAVLGKVLTGFTAFTGTVSGTDTILQALEKLSGDLQTLSTTQVSEGANLYFTNSRAITAPLTGYVAGAGTVTSVDTVISAIQKLDGNTAAVISNNLTFTGTKTFSGDVLVGAALKSGNYHIEPGENDDGNSGTALTVDWSVKSAQKITLTGNVTLTFSNPQPGGSYVLKVLTGTGGFNITWPASILWPNEFTPVTTPTAARADLFNFYYDGTNYWGSYSQAFHP